MDGEHVSLWLPGETAGDMGPTNSSKKLIVFLGDKLLLQKIEELKDYTCYTKGKTSFYRKCKELLALEKNEFISNNA